MTRVAEIWILHPTRQEIRKSSAPKAVLDRAKAKTVFTYIYLNETTDLNMHLLISHFFSLILISLHLFIQIRDFKILFYIAFFKRERLYLSCLILFCFKVKSRALTVARLSVILQTLENDHWDDASFYEIKRWSSYQILAYITTWRSKSFFKFIQEYVQVFLSISTCRIKSKNEIPFVCLSS